jgi:hypothetical protein
MQMPGRENLMLQYAAQLKYGASIIATMLRCGACTSLLPCCIRQLADVCYSTHNILPAIHPHLQGNMGTEAFSAM